MSSKTSWIHNFPIHPFLFAIYPIAALLTFNIGEVSASLAIRPTILSVILAGLFMLAAYGMLRNWKRTALIATVLLILFYSYGHVYIALKGINVSGFYLFRHRTLLPIWIVLSVLLIALVVRRSVNHTSLTYTLNLVGLFLLIFPLVQLTSFSAQNRLSRPDAENPSALDLKVEDQPPDIYYIILDGYGRADVLKSEFGYDNSDFLNALRDQGFYIADCSLSNYAQTQISLTSSLNFNYIDALSDRYVPGSEDRAGLDALIHHGVVRESLEKAGYTSVAFATGFIATEWTDADYFLGPRYSLGELNEFEALLMETTLARLIQDGNRLGTQTSGTERFRERTLYVLDKLDDLSYIKGPKLVFVHLVIPHPPYVFGPTGGPVESADVGTTKTQVGADRYRDQAIYISSRMMQIIPAIIENSAVPPIIVIQGDHGPTVPSSPQARMSNLNAYYLPGESSALYPTITPVNTFRVIFNAYFGQNLELLEDRSLYSEYDDPFNFRVVQNTCKSNEE